MSATGAVEMAPGMKFNRLGPVVSDLEAMCRAAPRLRIHAGLARRVPASSVD